MGQWQEEGPKIKGTSFWYETCEFIGWEPRASRVFPVQGQDREG